MYEQMYKYSLRQEILDRTFKYNNSQQKVFLLYYFGLHNSSFLLCNCLISQVVLSSPESSMGIIFLPSTRIIDTSPSHSCPLPGSLGGWPFFEVEALLETCKQNNLGKINKRTGLKLK